MSYTAPQSPPQIPAGNIYSSSPNASTLGQFSSPMNLQGNLAAPVPIISRPISTTRILLLSGFAPELRTRDLLAVFSPWEDVGGGLRVKWIDDRSAYIVFQDAIVAKKAFLSTVANMPPSLTSTLENPSQPTAKLTPYSGPEVDNILSSLSSRPRSRSNAGIAANATSSSQIMPSQSPMSGAASSMHNRRTSNAGMNGISGHIRRSSLGSGSFTPKFINGTPPSTRPNQQRWGGHTTTSPLSEGSSLPSISDAPTSARMQNTHSGSGTGSGGSNSIDKSDD